MFVTLGPAGSIVAEREGATRYLPAEPPVVRDVCGAGDTVAAALCVAMLAQSSLPDACRFALTNAGRQIATVGIAPVMDT